LTLRLTVINAAPLRVESAWFANAIRPAVRVGIS
jgi:hypothetical protein